MKDFSCRCCGTQIPSASFSTQILGREVNYYDCSCCGYVQTQDPTWLEEAYRQPINLTDTGIMLRNQANLSNVLATLALLRMRTKKVIDYAGGYGVLVRMLRDLGIDAFWHDAYTENLFAPGFEADGRSANLVTAFEAIEHFVDPNLELNNIFALAPNLLFSTCLIPFPTPRIDDWWYYGNEHGQHVGFFRLKTLQYLAKKYNKHLLTDGKALHLLTDRYCKYGNWFAWRLLSKISLLPLLLGLKSKTWSDHLMLKRQCLP
ncbi:MAG: class I SAM-dependent methyltransferase [Cyanobacteria bacterium K_DeepCast_35m_m2_023]|nr:class I SAM-dependent methyltransferase [Cyanobacteria bacterium K_DeepCast_35m_m2_023]